MVMTISIFPFSFFKRKVSVTWGSLNYGISTLSQLKCQQHFPPDRDVRFVSILCQISAKCDTFGNFYDQGSSHFGLGKPECKKCGIYTLGTNLTQYITNLTSVTLHVWREYTEQRAHNLAAPPLTSRGQVTHCVDNVSARAPSHTCRRDHKPGHCFLVVLPANRSCFSQYKVVYS